MLQMLHLFRLTVVQLHVHFWTCQTRGKDVRMTKNLFLSLLILANRGQPRGLFTVKYILIW